MNAAVQQESQALAVAEPAQQRALSVPAGLNMASPMAAAMMAMQAGIGVDQIKGMLEVQRDWEAGEARKAYVRDMAAFKANPPEIIKDKLVSFNDTSYKHATIGQVVEKVTAALATHGFSHNWNTDQEDGRIIVSCVITHREGHSESTTLSGAPDGSGKKNSIQQVASTVTYLQRYTLLLALGLATKDQPDDDGAGGAGIKITYDQDAELAKWTEAVNAAKTASELAAIRKQANAAFLVVKDVDSWNTIKALAAGRKDELAQPADKAAA